MQRYKHFMREIGKHSSNFCQANSNISFYSFWSLYSILHYDFSRNILHLQFTKILQHKIVYTKNFSSGEFLEAFQHWIFLLLYFLQILRYLMLSWRFYWWKIELSDISKKSALPTNHVWVGSLDFSISKITIPIFNPIHVLFMPLPSIPPLKSRIKLLSLFDTEPNW